MSFLQTTNENNNLPQNIQEAGEALGKQITDFCLENNITEAELEKRINMFIQAVDESRTDSIIMISGIIDIIYLAYYNEGLDLNKTNIEIIFSYFN